VGVTPAIDSDWVAAIDADLAVAIDSDWVATALQIWWQ
jgi:hypothetical protein